MQSWEGDTMNLIYSYKKYGLYQYDNIDHKKSKEEILLNFKQQFKEPIIKALADIGVTYKNLQYYSPRTYNHENDCIDLVINKVINKEKFKRAILNNKEVIEKALSDNKSYDGYTSLTVSDISEELERLTLKNYEPDLLVINTLLDLAVSTDDFHPEDYFVFLDNEGVYE